MGEILITGIDEDVLRELEERADLRGSSLEEIARDAVVAYAKSPFTPEERVAISRRFRAGQSVSPSLTSEEIREGLA